MFEIAAKMCNGSCACDDETFEIVARAESLMRAAEVLFVAEPKSRKSPSVVNVFTTDGVNKN